ncbi:hypothetical protein GIB67_028197 [Kingdonia uniflora]|uniref:Abnormal spindle-like microcephaly-associated protein n=1 Tax=Kingdonia uniflora TaxID=39325 RepID=A0A7J7KZ35_9MAGN|nr:hypothetical protein GIB67_028197 [Kingdonia uniflora]
MKWDCIVRSKFVKMSCKRTTDIILPTSISRDNRQKKDPDKSFDLGENDSSESFDFRECMYDLPSKKKQLSEEDIAARKIQAFFRRYLARWAFRALKSLVKIQAIVRGVQVRKQSQIAMHCMHTLIRLHLRIQARQLLCTAVDG